MPVRRPRLSRLESFGSITGVYVLIACVALFLIGLDATPTFAQQQQDEEEQQEDEQQEDEQPTETPLDFAQRTDVGDEIQLSDDQLAETEGLTEESNRICQQLFDAFFQGLSTEVRQQLLLAGPQAQLDVYNDIRQDVELGMLDQRVLQDPQMNRFNQLWDQRRGLDSLVSGRSSDRLNVSPNQRNQIRQIRNDGNQLINQCLQAPGSDSQREQIINSIQSIVINQSISVLENAQIEQLIVNLGQPFDFADCLASQTATGASQPVCSIGSNPVGDSGAGVADSGSGTGVWKRRRVCIRERW